MLLVREGAILNEMTATERANNIAMFLVDVISRYEEHLSQRTIHGTTSIEGRHHSDQRQE